MKRAICFFSSQQRFYQTRIAIESFFQYHSINDYDCYLLQCSSEPIIGPPSYIKIITYSQCLDNPEPVLIRYGYNGGLARPLIINYVLNLGYEKVLCLDGDMEVFNNFDWIFDSNCNVFVTPHITSPIPNDGLHPSMEDIRLAGTYNSAFFVCNNSNETKNFVQWWLKQSIEKGELKREQGLFSEQGWLQFVGDFIENVCVIKHPGFNSAYWRLHEMNLYKNPDGKWMINGLPLYVFHYSGFDMNNPESISVHQNRYKSGQLMELLLNYKKRLKENEPTNS